MRPTPPGLLGHRSCLLAGIVAGIVLTSCGGSQAPPAAAPVTPPAPLGPQRSPEENAFLDQLRAEGISLLGSTRETRALGAGRDYCATSSVGTELGLFDPQEADAVVRAAVTHLCPGTPVTVLPSRLATSFGDGTWTVGVDIAPGTYRSDGGRNCDWDGVLGLKRTDGGPEEVTLYSTGDEFSTRGCGTWTMTG